MLDKDDIVQVKEAFKWTMQGQVAKELGGVAVFTKVGAWWMERYWEPCKVF